MVKEFIEKLENAGQRTFKLQHPISKYHKFFPLEMMHKSLASQIYAKKISLIESRAL